MDEDLFRPTLSLEDGIGDVLQRLSEKYPDESVQSAVEGMDDAAKYNLMQSLYELEREITS